MNMLHSQYLKAGLIVVSLFALWACADKSPVYAQMQGRIFATTYSLQFRQPAEALDVDALQAEVDARLKQLDYIFSTYKSDSELSQFNAIQSTAEGSFPEIALPISPEFVEVFELSKRIYTLSNGAFDPSIGPLVNLWGFGPKLSIENFQQQPSEADIENALLTLNFDQQAVYPESITKTQAIYLDFSAVAKGYAVDQLVKLLESKGIKHMMVEIGGELATRGQSSRGGNWKIGVEAPENALNKTFSVLSLSKASVATSGDYRNYFEYEGVRYSHTLDPRSGKPIHHKLASVTVVADNVAEADAWATALMVLGEQEGFLLAQKLGLNALFIMRKESGFAVAKTGEIDQYIQ